MNKLRVLQKVSQCAPWQCALIKSSRYSFVWKNLIACVVKKRMWAQLGKYFVELLKSKVLCNAHHYCFKDDVMIIKKTDAGEDP